MTIYCGNTVGKKKVSVGNTVGKNICLLFKESSRNQECLKEGTYFAPEYPGPRGADSRLGSLIADSLEGERETEHGMKQHRLRENQGAHSASSTLEIVKANLAAN